MKKLYLFIILSFILSISVVSAGSMYYTGTNYNQTYEAEGYAVTPNYIWYSATNGCMQRMNINFTSETTVNCYSTATIDQIAYTNIDTLYPHALVMLSGVGSIEFRNEYNLGQDSTGINILNEIPVNYNITSVIDIATYNGNELVILGNDGFIYFFRIQEESIPTTKWLELFYLYAWDSVSFNSTNIVSASIQVDEDFVYGMDKVNSKIYVFDKVGGLHDVVSIVGNPNPKWFLELNSDLWIQDKNADRLMQYDLDLLALATNQTFTVGGETYNITLCIDDSYLCNATSYYISLGGNINFYCPTLDSTTYCSDECVNTKTNGVTSGVCTDYGCTSTCSIEGANECQTATTYTVCGNYDADACLEEGSVFNCPSNSYCVNDNILGASCQGFNDTGLYNQDYISVSAELFLSSGTELIQGYSKVPETTAKAKSVTSEYKWYDILSLGLGKTLFNSFKLMKANTYETELTVLTTTYNTVAFESNQDKATHYGTTCDYQEIVILADDLSHNDLSGSGWVGNGTVNISDGFYYAEQFNVLSKTLPNIENQRIETIIGLEDTGIYNIIVSGSSGVHLNFSIYHNKTSFQIIINESINNKIILDTTSTSDDLQEIYLSIVYNNDIQTATLEVSLVRDVLGQSINENYYSYPLSVGTLENPTSLNYVSNGNDMRVYQISSVNVNEYPVFKEADTDDTTSVCEFVNTGCKTTRVYANEQGVPTYHFYDDYQVCVSKLGNVIDGSANDGVQSIDNRSFLESFLNKDWDSKTKLFIAIIVTTLMFGVFIIIGVLEKMPSIIFVGVLMSGLMLFYFVVENYIEAWVIVLFIIIASSVAGLWLRKGLLGKDNGG